MERDPLEVLAAAGDAIVPLYSTLVELQSITIESAKGSPTYQGIQRFRRGKVTYARASDIVRAIQALRAKRESARHARRVVAFLRQHAPQGELRS